LTLKLWDKQGSSLRANVKLNAKKYAYGRIWIEMDPSFVCKKAAVFMLVPLKERDNFFYVGVMCDYVSSLGEDV
jgi:hypothetical protein